MIEIYNKFGVKITNNYDIYESLSKKYNINLTEIIQIDLNRSGIYLKNGEVKENFRVRFKGRILDDYETWFALPVRNQKDTPFWIFDDSIYFYDKKIGEARGLTLDTCETSYQRGTNLLNLNSRSRSNCRGCRACVHTYRDLYDNTVIKDQSPLRTKDDVEKFFKQKSINLSELYQIAVVTGLFGSEKNVVEHMSLISKVAKNHGFDGELMYFGCQVNSEEAIERLSKLGKFYLIYALDNFTKRDVLLSKAKALITLEDAKKTLELAKNYGIKTSIAYISGIDPLEETFKGFNLLKDSLTSFPIINVYQIQTLDQAKILDDDARDLDYYLNCRKEIEKIFKDTEYRPKRWENYRPLWYRYFSDEELPNNSFGEQEKIKIKELKNGRNSKTEF